MLSPEAALQFSSSLKPLRNKYGPCEACHVSPPPGRRWGECSSCKAVLYCSKECQVKDWADHKCVQCNPYMAVR